MGADQVGALVALKAHGREIVDPTIADHQGRMVKTTSDGMLVVPARDQHCPTRFTVMFVLVGGK